MVLGKQFSPRNLLIGKHIAHIICHWGETTCILLSNIIHKIIDELNHPNHGFIPFSPSSALLELFIARERTDSGLWGQWSIRILASTIKNKYGISSKRVSLSLGGLFTIC